MNDRISRTWIAAIEKQTQEVKTFPRFAAYDRKLRMSEFRKYCSFSFTFGLALCLICLAYISQWQNYAPRTEESMSPYLTPWTALSISILSLSLAIITVPVRPTSPVQVIVSKALGVCVFCFGAVFLLEYLCGVRVPDLDLFFLPDTTGYRVTLSSARPCPQSATTSMLFALAMLFYGRNAKWQLRIFQLGTVTALVLPSLAALGYIAHQPSWLKSGLCAPTIILYFALGFGFFRLCHRPKQVPITVPPTGRDFRH
jgi:hypothetical protein